MSIYPVIMCGGAGSRLWPASRPGRPKQFLALAGPRSLFQETVLRVSPLAESGGELIVVAGTGHAEAIAAQLADIGVSATVLLEPEARDSAPAMAAAAAFIQRRDPEGVAAIIASDHHIPDAEAFRAAVRTAAVEAGRGRIVTLGVAPTAPSSAYGYISPAGPGLAPVSRFVEKPDAATAAGYVAEGFLWNSGNFIVSARTLMEELALYAPDIEQVARAALPVGEGPVIRLTGAFRAAPKISIDYAVMEKSERTSVLPVAFAWSDLGAWDSVRDTGEGAAGAHIAVDSPGCLVRAPEGVVVATLGVSNLAIIVEPDAILVCDLSRAQEVKTVVDRIKAEAPRHADIPDARESAPWTRFGDWMRTAALPLWATLGTRGDGGFVEALTPEGRPAEVQRRVRVQSRQIFVFCRAGALGWRGPWRERAEAGLDRLLADYVRPDGAVRNALTADGAVLDDSALLYEQAFALLALATAHAAGIQPDRCEAQAGIMLDRLTADCLPSGGWREDGPHPWQANANMHLFEAAQAWAARGVDARWAAVADNIAELALNRFIDPRGGFLREFFGPDWAKADGEDGRLVEPGHQFEWSWLLSRHALARGDDRIMAAAKRLYLHGLRGVDAGRGVAVDAMDDTLAVRSPRARLWPQTEWLRAALAMADLSDGIAREQRLAEADRAMRGLALYLRPNGTWRDKLEPSGAFIDEPAPASSLYHIAGAFDQVCAAAAAGLISDAPTGLN